MSLNWDEIQGRTTGTAKNNTTYKSTIDWDKIQGRSNNSTSKSIDTTKTPAYNLLKNNTNQHALSAIQTLNKASNVQTYDDVTIHKQPENKSFSIKGPMQSLNTIKGGSSLDRTLADRQMKRNAGLNVQKAPLFTPVGLAEAGSSPIELVEAHRQAETELSNIANAKKDAGTYETYMKEENQKVGDYKTKLQNSMVGTDINEMARNATMLKNAEFGKRVSDLSEKYDDWVGFANYNLGDLQIEYNEAMAKYFDTQNISDLNEAKRIEELINLYSENATNVGQGGILTKDFAGYLPQLVGQTKTGLQYGGVAAGTVLAGGTAKGAIVGSAAGGVGAGPGAVAGAVSSTPLALKAGKAGYVAGVTKFSHTQMIGSAYSELLKLGVPNDVAKEVASDTALWQSVIEGLGAGVDVATLGIGKLFSKGAKTAGQITAKNLIANALKAYGINLISETTEEAVQEKIAIEGEKKAFEKAGMERTTTDEEDWQRIIQAGAGGFTIALVSGSGNVVGNITTTAINSNTKTKVNKIYNDQIDIVKRSNLSETQKQNKINELEVGKKNTLEAIDKQIKQTEGQKRVNINNVAPEVNNIQEANENNIILNTGNVQQQTNEVISQQVENQNNVNITQNSLLRQSVNKVQEQGVKIPENTITTLENIQNKRHGLNIEFDTSVNGNGMYTVNNDGTRTIKINPNSARAIEFTVVHELGHDLKTGDSKSYNDLQNFVLEYAKTKEGYETAIKALGETYSKQLGKENFVLDDEATNDILGEAIGNQEFLNSLAQKQPNLFQRIYNWLKNVLFDGNNTGRTLEERRFLNSLQSKFATAYNQSFNNTGNNQINYSIGGQVGMQNAINNDSRFTRLENNLNRAQTMAAQGVDNEYIRQQTNWFQDKNGDWKFEFSDKDMSLKKGIVLEENKTYKLGDILEHDTLFLMYPQLAKYNVKFESMDKKGGSYNKENNLIRINSKLKSKEDIQSTLIHEIQHAIQKIEGFKMGRSSKWSKLAYYNSLGEIEADNTKNRYIEEQQGNLNRDLVPPESSKTNPKHSRLDTYLNKRTISDKIKDGIYKYLKNRGVISDSISEELDNDNKRQNSNLVVGRRGYIGDYKNRGVINGQISKEFDMENQNENTGLVVRGRSIEGLEDSSSFSLPENNWQSFLDENFDLNPDSTKTKAIKINKAEERIDNAIGNKVIKNENKDIKPGATVTTRKYEVSKINNFMNKVLSNMETTRFGNTKELRNITKGITRDIRADSLTEEKLNQYANVIYDAANRIDTQYYEENKDLKNNIRNTRLYVSPETRSGITDWQDFRKSNFGILSISDEKSSLPVDTFYNELSKERADLFPDNIINEIDQLERISEVAKSIRKIEQKASEYLENNYGKEIRAATIEEIKKNINELSSDIKQVQKVEADNLKKTTEKEELRLLGNDLTVAEIKELHKQNKHLKKDYEKAYRKELLTEKDKKHLERLVKGEITLDEISGTSNKEAIKRLYEYKKPLEENNNKILQAKKAKKAVRFEMAEEAVKNSGTWKDKKVLGGLRYSTEIAERNIYDIIPDRTEAKNVIDTYFKPVHVHEAQATRKKNEIIEKVKKLNIDTKEKYQISESIRNKINEQLPPGEVYKENMLSESSLVQLLGEKVINIKDIQELGADVSKIENATNVFRDIYNELFELSNDALISNGYNPVEYRKDYFPHFSEEKPDSTIKKIANKLGIETSNKELPTDLAGLTHTFKPGKKWVGNFLERKGKVTDYNALKGLDTYLGPVMDVIYHTDDIQNLRALEDSIRYKYSSKGVQEQIDETRDRLDLDDIQKNAILNDLYNTDTTDFSHFVTWLRGYTDNLSGKKSIEDRNMEHKLGRAAYNTMKNVEGRVASNMIGANINSALTNFIPIVQGWGEVSSGSMTKAMWDTARNAAKADGLTDTSDFLVNRRGNDKLYKTTTDKISEKAGILMRTIDEFTSETLVRAKYYDNIKAGMSQEDAMSNANEFGASIMGDRSKGAMPTIYNEKNPITKTFTMFQLEVNNQYRYWLKDLPKNVKDEVGNSLAKALFKIFLGSWIYGELKEKITGTRSVTDPIDIVADTFKDVLSEDIGAGQTIMNLGNRIIDELPFINTLTGGGRIPISSAFPDIENTLKATTGLTTGEMDSKKAGLTLLKELSKPAYYFLLPTAGGQVKKAIEGISAVANGGEYGIDAEGNKKLKFPIDTSNMNALEKLGTYAKAATFGKYSLPTAKDYVDSGYKQLSAKKTQGYQEAIKKGISADTYLSVEKQIRNVKPDGEKFVNNERRTKIINIIESQDLTKEQKEYLYKVFYKNEI